MTPDSYLRRSGLVSSPDRLAGLVAGQRVHRSRSVLAWRWGMHAWKQKRTRWRSSFTTAGLPPALSIVAGRPVLDPQIPVVELAAELCDRSSRLEAFDAGEPACLKQRGRGSRRSVRISSSFSTSLSGGDGTPRCGSLRGR